MDSLIALTKTNISTKDKADVFNKLAFKYLVFDSINTANYASQAIRLSKEIDYAEGQSDAYYAIGWVTMIFGHNASAIDLFNQVLEISKAADYQKGMANAYNGLGDANRNTGNYAEALTHHLNALKLRELLKDRARVASSYNNIGIIYYTQQDYQKALEYYLGGLEIRRELGDLRQVAVSLNNIGIVYVEQRDFLKGLDYYEQCLTINETLGNKSDIARNYHNIGVVYCDHLKDYHEGISYYSKALGIYQELSDNASQTYPLLGLGSAHYSLKNYSKARNYTLASIQLSENAGLLSNLNEGYRILANIENGLGNHKNAFEALKANKTLSDSLRNEEQTKKLTLLEAEYKFQKEKDVIELENEKEKLAINEELKRERIIRYAAFAGSIISLIALFVLYRYYKLKKDANVQLSDKNQKLKQLREREKELSEEAMSIKERELATMAMASHEKNNLLESLEQTVSSMEGRMDQEMKSSFQQVRKTISESKNLDKSWDSFIHRFEDIHPGFFNKIKKKFENLSVNDLKLAAYIKIGMGNQEIANVTFLALGSVKSNINRLKKKMQLGANDSIRDFVLKS